MPDWGLSETGWYRPRLPEIRTELVSRWKARFGGDRNTAHDTVDGQFIDFASECMSLSFEQSEGAYLSNFFDTTFGIALDLWAAGKGFIRHGASSSTATAYLYGTDTTPVPEGSVVATDPTGNRFVTDAATTIGGSGDAYVVEIVEAVDSELYRIVIDGNNHNETPGGGDTVDDIRDALVTAINGGPTAASAFSGGTKPDGGAILVITGASGLVVSVTGDTPANLELYDAEPVAVSSESTGPIAALATTLNAIQTPVTGWEGAVNVTDAVLGANEETDGQFKARIRSAVEAGGIKAALLKLAGVESVTIFENDTDTPDPLYGATHWVEALVVGGDDQEIRDAIWRSKCAGIGTQGDTSGTEAVTGDSNTVKHSRGSDVDMYLDIEITAGEGFPTGSASEVALRDAIVAWANAAHAHGDDVAPDEIRAQIPDVLPGKFAAVVKVEDQSSPTNTGIFAIADREVARFDTSRTTVTIS